MATTRNIRYGISTPETFYNDIISDSSTYIGLLSQDRNPMLPNQEKEDDNNVSGRGQEWRTRQFGVYWERPRFVFSDRVNTDNFALHLRRVLGGTDAVTGAGVDKTHTIFQVDAQVTQQLPSANIADTLLASDFLWMGNCCDSLVISQQGAAIPTYSATYIGSGKHRRIRYMTTSNGYASNFGAIPLPSAEQNTVRGPNVALSMNDGTSYDITAAGILRSITITISNNHIVDDKRIGNPYNLVGAAAGEIAAFGYGTIDDSGWVQNHLEFGERDAAVEVSVLMETATLRHWDAMRKDIGITGFKYTTSGKVIAGGTLRHTAEINMPLVYVNSTQAGDDGGRAIVNFRIIPAYDQTQASKSMVTGKIINAQTTAIL